MEQLQTFNVANASPSKAYLTCIQLMKTALICFIALRPCAWFYPLGYGHLEYGWISSHTVELKNLVQSLTRWSFSDIPVDELDETRTSVMIMKRF